MKGCDENVAAHSCWPLVVSRWSFGALGATVCPSECDVSSATGFERGGLIGVVLGGAIGAIVGLTVHSWRLRVP